VARKVESFPELPAQSRYPWDSWLDGDIWELTPGDDFKGKADNFRAVAVAQSQEAWRQAADPPPAQPAEGPARQALHPVRRGRGAAGASRAVALTPRMRGEAAG
jgi:hypothetical protein